MLIFTQTSVTLFPSSSELRVLLGADVQYVGCGLASVDTKDISCQRQWHVVGLVNNVENVIFLLFLWFKKKTKKQQQQRLYKSRKVQFIWLPTQNYSEMHWAFNFLILAAVNFSKGSIKVLSREVKSCVDSSWDEDNGIWAQRKMKKKKKR